MTLLEMAAYAFFVLLMATSFGIGVWLKKEGNF